MIQYCRCKNGRWSRIENVFVKYNSYGTGLQKCLASVIHIWGCSRNVIFRILNSFFAYTSQVGTRWNINVAFKCLHGFSWKLDRGKLSLKSLYKRNSFWITFSKTFLLVWKFIKKIINEFVTVFAVQRVIIHECRL